MAGGNRCIISPIKMPIKKKFAINKYTAELGFGRRYELIRNRNDTKAGRITANP